VKSEDKVSKAVRSKARVHPSPLTPHTSQDEKWMRHALELADRAERAGEVPIGAVVVVDNELIAEQLDNVKKKNDIIDDIFKKDQDPMAQRMKLANLLIHDPDLLDVLDNVKVILDRIAEKKEER